MKRIILVLTVLFLLVGMAYGMNYEVTKKAGDYTVQVKIDRNPPIVGDNNMMIWLKDATGNDVKGAMITVDYNKSTKLWMRAKKYNSYASPHENSYHAILAIPKQGTWKVTIKINHKGKSVSTKFTIDVK
ncbi:MAG: hypothetical protein ACYDGO_14740 [Smithellaceae bacterium]